MLLPNQPIQTSDIAAWVEDSNEYVRAKLLESVLQMPYDTVEVLVGQLLSGVGYTNLVVTARGADGGVDLRAEKKVELGTVKVVVQVKRYKRNISVEIVRALRGCLAPGEQGVLITTSAFTRTALTEAVSLGRVPIWLVDGLQLTDMLVEQGIGIRKSRPLILELLKSEPLVQESLVTNETVHDPISYQPRYTHTPRGRRIEIAISAHFDKQRAGLLPIFSVLAGAALRVSAEVDYFAIRDHIVFTVGSDNQRTVVLLVKVQVKRLVLFLRLPTTISYTTRLLPYQDKGWYMLKHKVYLTTPSDIDDEMRFWLKVALAS
jgi:hypothetical protein